MILVAAVLFAAGCSTGSGTGANGPDQAEPAPSSATPTPSATPPSATPLPSRTPPSPAELPPVMVLRTGGFAGVSDKYTVTPQGALTVATRAGTANRQLGQADLDQLRALATDPAFAAEAKAGRSGGTTRCRDGFNYSVTVGRTRVSGTDCGGNLAQSAPTMWKIVQLIEGAAQR